MSKVKAGKGEIKRLARSYARLVRLAAAADDAGDDDTANKLYIRAEIESGRLVGRRVA